MSKVLSGILIFAAGAVTTYFVTARTLSSKYDKRAEAEIESVREAFSTLNKAAGNAPQNVTADKDNQQKIDEYEDKVKKYSTVEKSANDIPPRVISPTEFGSREDYDTLTYTRYADGTIADDTNRPLSGDTIDEYIGIDNLSHFGEYEEDSLHICNDRYRCYIEVLADERKYADVLHESPFLKS